MHVCRRRQAQRRLQLNLAGRAAEQVRTAYHMRDPEGGIVHDDGQLVRPQSVATTDDEVPDAAEDVLELFSLDTVQKFGPARLDAKAQCGFPRRCDSEDAFGRMEQLFASRTLVILRNCRKLRARAMAFAQPSPGAQHVNGLGVFRSSFTLPDQGAIPTQVESLEGTQDVVGRSGPFARRIKVLDADQPLAAT